jgi:excisionase family DNA binding protein
MSTNIQVQRLCQFCGEEFTAKTTVTKYCSLRCASRAGKARKSEEKIVRINTQTRQAVLKPIEEIRAKAYLSIAESSRLMGISRRTIYRMIDRGDLNAGKAGRRTLLRREDIDKLFQPLRPAQSQQTGNTDIFEYQISDCYSLTDIQIKYKISEKAIYDIIIRNEIPKIRQGRFAYVPKMLIDKILK